MFQSKNTTFSVLQFEHDDKPVYATIDFGYKNFTNKEQYPWYLSVSVPLINPTIERLSTEEDAKELNRFEDNLEKKLKDNSNFCYIGRVTWNGYREIIYYIDKPEEATNLLQGIINSGEFRKFTFKCEKDKVWKNIELYLT